MTRLLWLYKQQLDWRWQQDFPIRQLMQTQYGAYTAASMCTVGPLRDSEAGH